MSLPPAVQAIVSSGSKTAWMTNGTDPWDVFVCHVPADTKSAVYAGLPVRLALRADALSTILNDQVGAYFTTLSHGDYRPQFSAAGDVSIAATDEPQACVDKALAAASPMSHGVLVVADAEHNANQPGGFGNPGECMRRSSMPGVGNAAIGVCRRRGLRSAVGRSTADGPHRARARSRSRLAAQRLRPIADRAAPQRARRDERQRGAAHCPPEPS